MIKNLRTLTVATIAIFALGACEESQFPVATGKGNLRGINAIITAPDVRFRIEESTNANGVSSLSFKDTHNFRYDNLSYNVNFETRLAEFETDTRIATVNVDVVANTTYILALTGSIASPTVLQLEFDERQWSGSETVFEGRALNLATTLGELDVYFAAPGTVPVLGEAVASIGYGEISAGFEPAAGDYEITITTKDDPNDVLYRSPTITQGPATSVIYSVFDPDPSITGPVSVRVMGATGAGAELPDPAFPPGLRVMHAALGTGNTDVYIDDDFTAPFVADIAFGEVTSYVDFDTGATPVTLTPAGDTGVLLLEDTLTLFAGTLATMYLVGEPAELDIVALQSNPRSIETAGRLRIVNLAANSELFDIYIHGADELITDIVPSFADVPFRANTGYLSRDADSYEITITQANETDVVAGPFTLDLSLGDVVELAILDTADPNLFEIVEYGN